MNPATKYTHEEACEMAEGLTRLRAEFRRERARVVELEATLRGIEFEGRDIDRERVCPACDYGPKEGHVHGCPIAMALGSYPHCGCTDGTGPDEPSDRGFICPHDPRGAVPSRSTDEP